jgi:nucleotide-binding universal stress UspA family protein
VLNISVKFKRKIMDKILIATDFSINANKAALVGIELAKKFNAEVHILHSYSLPIINAEVPDYYDFGAYQKIKSDQLNTFIKSLPCSQLVIHKHCIAGVSMFMEVEEFSQKNNIDLIIIGLTGASAIEALLMGSNTLNLISNSKTPILAIPLHFELKDQHNIGFAFDGKKIDNKKNIDFFRKFTKKFTPKIQVFHVSPIDNNLEIYQKLKTIVPFDEFNLKIELNDDVEAGILEFTTNNKIDILGIVPRKHSFFAKLFHERYTREVARYATLPILTIPD